MKKELKFGIFQALGVALYCTTIGTIMQNGSKFFGERDTFITPIFVLTMFCVSALICALIVFKKPYELFFSGKRDEALSVVVYTAASLFIFLLFLFGLMFFVK
ncbi:MAG: hypothetical protein WA152_01505 [Microgenomates group bacterium]